MAPTKWKKPAAPMAGLIVSRFVGTKKTGRKVLDPQTGDMVDERKEGLPKRYHKDSTLTVEVTPDKRTYDFELKSK